MTQNHPDDTLYESPTVTFPDTALRDAIEDQLRLTSDTDITQENMLLLTQLTADLKGISNLIGIEYAQNLKKELDLYDNAITDITPLAKLTKLEALYLNHNTITDINPLAKLTKLEHLSLVDNAITDISPLSQLTKLKRLYLSHNAITDISPLIRLAKLEWLGLASNGIRDLSPLSKLLKLKTLYIGHNLLSDGSINEIIPILQANGTEVCFLYHP